MKQIKCPSCGEQNSVDYKKLLGDFNILKCSKCGVLSDIGCCIQ